MRYIDLIVDNPLVWGLFLLYLVGTSYLAWLGHKKTTDIKSFAVGGGDMSPIIVGITLAASVASAATFVLNPGLVYAYGVSALAHLGGAAGLGILVGLFSLSFGFRRLGAEVDAITLPQWVGQRYGSRVLTGFFAFINLLSVTFMVLIVAGLAIVMQGTLGLTNTESVVLIIGFVFSYIFMGGTYAHAYTNTLQGIVMVVIATIIVLSGIHHFADGWGGMMDELAKAGPHLTQTTSEEASPAFPLYGSLFSVWISGFIVGFALVCQPHILTKALYVKSDKAVMKYLLVATVVSLIFTALLFVGLYAHLSDIPREAFLGENGLPRPDAVVTVYINESFGPVMRAIIAVALLAAGMSTLDGILVALSSIAANDLFLNIASTTVLKNVDEERQAVLAHRASQIILILLGLITLVISLDPPETISIFGQIGVFGMVAVSAAPIFFGIFAKGISKWPIFAASIAGFATYTALFLWGQGALDKVKAGDMSGMLHLEMADSSWAFLFDTDMFMLGLLNPAVPASYAVLVSFTIVLPFAVMVWVKNAQAKGASAA